MQVRARKAFKSEYGMVRIGNIFTCEPSLAKEYEKLGNVEIVPEKFGPDRIQARTTAPHIKTGKVESTEPPLSPVDQVTADLREGGQAAQSPASPPGRRSRRRT